jgi:hypothetical protein
MNEMQEGLGVEGVLLSFRTRFGAHSGVHGMVYALYLWLLG